MSRTAALVAALACAGATLVACSGRGGSGGSTSPTMPSSSTPTLVSSITPQLATAMAAAARAVTAVTSYDYRHLDASHDAAVRNLADPFRSQYETAWPTVQSHAPKERAVVAGKIDNVGLSDVTPDRVSVLVFDHQTITNTSTSRPRVDAVTLQARMTLSSGRWLLSDMSELGASSPGDRAKTAWAASGVAAAVLAGRQCATALTTIDASSIDAELAAMQQCTTGDLLRSVHGDEQQLRQAAARSSATSTVVASGLSTAAPDRVELLVAVAGKTTPRGGTPANRFNRLLMTLQQDGGRWLASKAEQQ